MLAVVDRTQGFAPEKHLHLLNILNLFTNCWKLSWQAEIQYYLGIIFLQYHCWQYFIPESNKEAAKQTKCLNLLVQFVKNIYYKSDLCKQAKQ